MSKKKATMTLKDFHGGSIPSDLPLPSAPGVTVRPMDRPGFDRPRPWANPMGRPYQLRPGSAGSVRTNFDDKTPFLGPNTHIGRNFDEDERKPLDGVSGPRKTVSDDTTHVLPMRSEVARNDYSVAYRPPSNPQIPSIGPSSYAGKVTKLCENNGSVSDVASKLAHASALDKVSSGMWQLNKQPIHHVANVEPIRDRGTERIYHLADVAGGVEHVEKNLNINKISAYEKARSFKYPDKIEDKFHSDKLVESERPKLKLLPRSKPLDGSEPPVDHNQGHCQPQSYDNLHKVNESYETGNNTMSVLTVSDSGNLAVERPKLNLKPRSQAFEQMEENKEKRRNTVFGGARPRELVLKERGVDGVIVNNHDMVQPPSRVKQDIPRTEILSPLAPPIRYNGKTDATPLDNKLRKNNDRRDIRVDIERTDTLKKNWKHPPHHQPPQERPPSPDTWRKPVEDPRPTSSDGPGPRFGKAASAVELAQAFSKSVSDPKMVDRFANQRGKVPFSRLTDPSSRPQINGY